ncbi:prostaglandin-H2 D-isomerase [Elysia marginata]|uniref:Prostaglandin-H2 D-isomerase n=1 Tax=Elysia marginata TaxID=1093978 RepID=A0AAV4HS01_9GAST|nr:prostaglandin-H2 D-isomerase [Elysia marginata]
MSLPGVQGKCMFPSPSSNFTLSGYYGVWYEIGKIQTAGGAAFEKDCVCTTIDVQPRTGGQHGDSTALNSCRKLTPTGKFLNATGQLTEMNRPGKWKEGFFFAAPKVDYTVIYLDKNFAVEYDCGDILDLYTNYCIHIMARVPNPDAAGVQAVLNFAEKLALNTENLPYQATLQKGCW